MCHMFTCRLAPVTCQVLHVTWHMPPVACHLSIMPPATATDPANSPTMHRRLVCKDPKIQKISEQKKLSQPLNGKNV